VGFRQFSHFFTGIHLALRQGELDEARRLLAEWRGRSGDRLSSGDIARLAIEQALLDSHRHVFAPLLWFALLGPAGALFYRLAHGLDQHWGRAARPSSASSASSPARPSISSTGCRSGSPPPRSPWSAISRAPRIAGGRRL
jgi:cobalamin biosynthesis protein CobD/CbiB